MVDITIHKFNRPFFVYDQIHAYSQKIYVIEVIVYEAYESAHYNIYKRIIILVIKT